MELQYLDKLKRNYIENPLKPREKPYKEDIVFLYIDCNLPLNELTKFFNVCQSTFANWLKFYNIKKPRNLLQQNVQKKCLEKYGTTTASKSDIVKEKAKQTCREKYGVDSYCQTEKFRQQSRETCLEKYGVEYASQNPEFQEKVRKTSLEKYGADHWLSTKRVKDQVKQTCLEKWGTTNVSTRHIDPKKLKILNTKEELWKLLESYNLDVEAVSKYLGVTFGGVEKKLIDFNLWDKIPIKCSNNEEKLKQLFPTFKKSRSIIYPYEIDLYNDKFKLGIEFNGTYWHSTKFKDNLYHYNKSKLAQEKGIFIYHIFEYEWNSKKDIILSQLNYLMNNIKQKINARDCFIVEIDNILANKFLQENDIQGSCKNDFCIGLCHKDSLVCLMCFYKDVLTRFCCKNNIIIRGGISKLFKYYINKYNPQKIITYSDIGKSKGNIYSLLGFNKIDFKEPTYLWTDFYKMYSPQDLEGYTEQDLYPLGFYKIYNCGNYVWEYTNY